MEEQVELGRLISKKLTSSLSDAEQSKLDVWLDNEDNRETYQNLIHHSKIDERCRQYSDIDIALAKQLYYDKLNKRSSYGIGYRVLRYASIIVLLISISISLFVIFEVSNNKENLSKEIVPGSAKAQLIMADGSIVELGNHSGSLRLKEKGVGITDENKLLTYTPLENANESEVYNKLFIPVGGEYQLKLSDGTKVWLNSQSELKYPQEFISATRLVELSGEAFFEVAKDVDKPFVVKTSEQELLVLGTSFNVSAYPDEKHTITTLVEGKVQSTFLNTNNHEVVNILTPNHQITIDNVLKNAQIDKVNPYLFVSWKDGRFVFRDEELLNILQEMQRWYGFTVVYENEEIKHHHFSIDIKRYDSFNKVIDLFEMTGLVDFEVDGNILYARSTV